jgi:hypothetical protein
MLALLVRWEEMSAQERRPAVIDRGGSPRRTPLDDSYLFSPEHFDNAFDIELEMLVAFARQMLYRPQTGADPYDTPIIAQRRQEAAKAALDVLWAIMAERNIANGEPPPTPASLTLRTRPLRRTRQLGT